MLIDFLYDFSYDDRLAMGPQVIAPIGAVLAYVGTLVASLCLSLHDSL